MKGFVNTVLGEPYEEEFEAPEWERIYERRDCLECEIVAWGRNKESWSTVLATMQTVFERISERSVST